jgi:hypothetical protein
MSDRGEYRPIFTVLVHGADYQQLSPSEKLVLLHCKLNLGAAGIGVLYIAALAEQTGISDEGVRLALATLEHRDWVRVERNVIWVVNGLKYEPSLTRDNANHRKWLRRHLDGLPNLAVVNAFRARYADWLSDGNPNPVDTPSKGIPNPLDTPSVPLPITTTTTTTTTNTKQPSAAGAAVERPKRVRTLTATPAELLVLEAYKGAHPMSRPGGDDQIRMIRKLLGAGYTAPELVEAIEGNKTDVWAAERGKHELTWIFRNRDNVDRYRAEYQRQHAPAVGENGELSAETLRLVRGA